MGCYDDDTAAKRCLRCSARNFSAAAAAAAAVLLRLGLGWQSYVHTQSIDVLSHHR